MQEHEHSELQVEGAATLAGVAMPEVVSDRDMALQGMKRETLNPKP